jgi:hypothetical protein
VSVPKFVVNTITRSPGYVYDSQKDENIQREVHTTKLFPVTGGDSAEDKSFWAATPSGSIELGHSQSCRRGRLRLYAGAGRLR